MRVSMKTLDLLPGLLDSSDGISTTIPKSRCLSEASRPWTHIKSCETRSDEICIFSALLIFVLLQQKSSEDEYKDKGKRKGEVERRTPYTQT